MNQVAERYAQAFFSLAAEDNKVAELKQQATDMLNVVDRDVIKFLDDILYFHSRPAVPVSKCMIFCFYACHHFF